LGAESPDYQIAERPVNSFFNERRPRNFVTRIASACYNRDMKPLPLKSSSKQQRIQRTKDDIFLSGVRCGSVIAKELVKSGWENLDKLPAEVVSRVTGKRPVKDRT
jgi:hypothetical protein